MGPSFLSLLYQMGISRICGDRVGLGLYIGFFNLKIPLHTNVFRQPLTYLIIARVPFQMEEVYSQRDVIVHSFCDFDDSKVL